MNEVLITQWEKRATLICMDIDDYLKEVIWDAAELADADSEFDFYSHVKSVFDEILLIHKNNT